MKTNVKTIVLAVTGIVAVTGAVIAVGYAVIVLARFLKSKSSSASSSSSSSSASLPNTGGFDLLSDGWTGVIRSQALFDVSRNTIGTPDSTTLDLETNAAGNPNQLWTFHFIGPVTGTSALYSIESTGTGLFWQALGDGTIELVQTTAVLAAGDGTCLFFVNVVDETSAYGDTNTIFTIQAALSEYPVIANGISNTVSLSNDPNAAGQTWDLVSI